MAFRRRRSFRRRSRRSFTRTRPTTETQRWESATFDVVNTITTESTPVISLFELVKVFGHFGDPTDQIGTVLGNAVRFIEVGGVVWDFHVVPLTSPEADVVAYTKFHKSLVTLQVDAGGTPALWDPFVTQPPIAVVSSDGDDDVAQPIRIHWRESELLPSGELNNVAFPPWNFQDRQRTHSLRLRRRIDDHQGLYFVIATDGGATASVTWTYWIHGTLYYRVRIS